MPKPRKQIMDQGAAERGYKKDAARARARAAGVGKQRVIPSMPPIAKSLAGAQVARARPPANDVGRSIRQAAAFTAAVPYAAAQLVRNAVSPPKPKAIDRSAKPKVQAIKVIQPPKPRGMDRKASRADQRTKPRLI